MRSVEKSIEDLFYEEAEKRLALLKDSLENFCRDGSQRDEISHTLHTLKGSASMVGLDDVSTLAHRMEDTLQSLDWQATSDVSKFASHLSQLERLLFPARIEEKKSDESLRVAQQREGRSAHAYRLLAGLSHLRTLSRHRAEGDRRDRWQWDSQFERELKLLARSALNTVFCPVNDVFAGLQELVSSMLRAERKRAKLVLKTKQKHVLRDLVPELRACLIHLLSNSIVHGLELPADRKRHEKAAEGRLNVEVSRQDGRLKILVGDDGRGIDLEKLKTKISERHPDLAWEALSKSQKLELLFQAGTTLADRLTLRAGRGVGLSAVRDSLGRLGGRVRFIDTPGLSTSVELEIPIPIFMEHCLEARSGSQTFLICSHSVHSVREVASEQDAAIRALHEFLGIQGAHEDLPHSKVLMGEKGTCLVAEVRGLSDTLVYPPPLLEHLPAAVVGFAEHESESGLAYVVDLAALDLDERVPRASPSATLLPVVSRRVLVVDDSPTTRAIMVEILARSGYDVVEAVDGGDGWTKLLEESYDFVICDYEMPVMNGLELLEAIRSHDSDLQHLAFLLFTSRDDKKTFEKAMLLGADKCVSKAHFDEGEFLQTLERLAS